MGSAETLKEPDESFDIYTAGQCWHWFDRPKAAAEAFRILKPSGRIIIAHFDWIPMNGNLVEATENLILKYNPDWALSGGTGIYPEWLSDLKTAGFDNLETRSFDLEQPYSPEAWRGRIRASAGIKASLNDSEISAFDDELRNLLEDKFSQNPLMVPHRVWFVTGKKPDHS
jgi:SAM-dependent methyltransferase